MKALVQRVSWAKTMINKTCYSEISQGLVIYVGFSKDDTEALIPFFVDKIIGLRIFEDEHQKMNLSLQDIKGSCMLVSQFTLYGNCTKGKRPNFMAAMAPEQASRLFDAVVDAFKKTEMPIATGQFAANMQIASENDGPVTLMIEKNHPVSMV